MRLPVVTLILLAMLTFVVGLGRQAISDSDEGFYAEASREMVERGDWLTPYFNYEQRWQKPVLYYWLTAATYLVTGPTEFGARFWSALSGVGLVLLTWAAARRITGREDAAWLAGAIAATSYGYFAMARLALPDLPLAFCVTLGIWAALEGRWLLAGAAAGVGFLMKGPIALVVPALVLLPIWWRERRVRRPPVAGLAVAAAAFVLIGLPWYATMTVEHGPAYLQSFFVGDNLERFATDRFNEPREIWFYIPILLGGLLPWTFYLLALTKGPADVIRGRRRLSGDEWRLVLWALVPLLFFTLSIGKQPRYILPVLPPMAILFASGLAWRIREPGDGRGLAAATWATAAFHVVFAVLLFRARPLFVTVHPAMTVLAVAAIVAGGGVLAWIAASRQWTRLPIAMTACAAALLLAVQFGALAGLRPEPVEEMATLVRAHRTGDEPVGEYEAFVRNLVFYAGFPQVELYDEGRALDFLQSDERVLLVVRAGDLPRLESISGVSTRTLGQVRYLDTANIRLRTLLSPLPDQDLDTILLVTNQ